MRLQLYLEKLLFPLYQGLAGEGEWACLHHTKRWLPYKDVVAIKCRVWHK